MSIEKRGRKKISPNEKRIPVSQSLAIFDHFSSIGTMDSGLFFVISHAKTDRVCSACRNAGQSLIAQLCFLKTLTFLVMTTQPKFVCMCERLSLPNPNLHPNLCFVCPNHVGTKIGQQPFARISCWMVTIEPCCLTQKPKWNEHWLQKSRCREETGHWHLEDRWLAPLQKLCWHRRSFFAFFCAPIIL